MSIEIRELLIKVKIEEPELSRDTSIAPENLMRSISELCEKEVRRQLRKQKDR